MKLTELTDLELLGSEKSQINFRIQWGINWNNDWDSDL